MIFFYLFLSESANDCDDGNDHDDGHCEHLLTDFKKKIGLA